MTIERCFWVPSDDPVYIAYHDGEWGRPTSDDRALFEKVSLEAFQSGLSWRTILGKREGFRAAFADFEPARIADFDDDDVERLVADAGIVRHRGKITATIGNARCALRAIADHGSLGAWFWSFEPPEDERPALLTEEVARALTPPPSAVRMAKALRKAGWRHVGPTTVYAFMQAAGIVNDHEERCFARAECLQERAAFGVPGR